MYRMGELIYSILRYEPSIVSGEKINLGAIFHYPSTDYREFYSITRWARVSAFDDTLNIPLMKDLMQDIRFEMGTSLSNPQFEINKFCSKYNSELYFDTCIPLTDVSEVNISSQIEDIKKLYFQFEYDVSARPSNDDQKKFLRRLLTSKQVAYVRNYTQIVLYGDVITYDFSFGEYGVVFFNLNSAKIDNKTMNKVKAWAWNAKNSTGGLKLLILYDLADESRPEIKPALEIFKSVAYKMINIHEGFGEVSPLLEIIS